MIEFSSPNLKLVELPCNFRGEITLMQHQQNSVAFYFHRLRDIAIKLHSWKTAKFFRKTAKGKKTHLCYLLAKMRLYSEVNLTKNLFIWYFWISNCIRQISKRYWNNSQVRLLISYFNFDKTDNTVLSSSVTVFLMDRGNIIYPYFLLME